MFRREFIGMENIITINHKDGFIFTCKEEILNSVWGLNISDAYYKKDLSLAKKLKINKLENETLYSLNNNYSLSKFLHNKKGPALINLNNKDAVEFWVDGKQLTDKEEIKQLTNYYTFNNKFDKFLNE